VSGDDPQNQDLRAQEEVKVAADPAPSGQSQEPSTNPEVDSVQLPNMADFLSQEHLQAMDLLAQRYGQMDSPLQDPPNSP
jgi:hypothetical protein